MNILERAIMEYGAYMQLDVAVEEMSELIKEICKYKRGNENYKQIAEELADVSIMIDQMKIIFGNANLVKEYRKQKLERLEKRLNE